MAQSYPLAWEKSPFSVCGQVPPNAATHGTPFARRPKLGPFRSRSSSANHLTKEEFPRITLRASVTSTGVSDRRAQGMEDSRPVRLACLVCTAPLILPLPLVLSPPATSI